MCTATKIETASITYEPIGCRYDVTVNGTMRSAYMTSVDGADCLRLGPWDDTALPHAEALAAKFSGRVYRYNPDGSSVSPAVGAMLVILDNHPLIAIDPIEDDDD